MKNNKWRNIIKEEDYAWLEHAFRSDPAVNRIWYTSSSEEQFFRELAKYKVKEVERLLSNLQNAAMLRTEGPVFKLNNCIICGKTLECPDHCAIGKAKEENEIQ